MHALFAKNAIGAVLDAEEYERIISGESAFADDDSPVVPDDASSLTGDATDTGKTDGDGRVELGKSEDGDEADTRDAGDDGENGSKS